MAGVCYAVAILLLAWTSSHFADMGRTGNCFRCKLSELAAGWLGPEPRRSVDSLLNNAFA